jgi:hypothetical protein
MAGNVTISGFLNGTPGGQINVGPFTLAASASTNLEVLTLTLASGANTITVPVWSPVTVGCLIIPNTSNATGITLKGVTGDTGVPLDPSGPTLLNFPPSPPASFVLTAASLFTTITSVVFF